MNMWIGIPLNLIALFSIAYLFSSNLKNPVVIPFGLQYLFMVFDPVSSSEISIRLCSLAFGAFFIMAIQFIANKGKFKKSFRPLILGVIKDLELLITEENIDCTSTFRKIDSLKKIILEKRKKGYYLSKEAKEVTNVIWLLEAISIEISRNKVSLNRDEKFKENLLNNIAIIKEAIISDKKEHVNLKNYKLSGHEDLNKLSLLFKNLISEIEILWRIKDLNNYNYSVDIPNYFNKKEVMKREFKLNSLKVSYGIRLAIIGTASIFIVQFFNFSEGKWMAYTIFSLIQPYAESSKTRIRERIEGTLIGAVLIVVLFYLVKSPAARGLIILAAGYLNPFVKGYKSLIVLVTVSAVASTALVSGGTIQFALFRILFVICGSILAFLGSKYIFHYKIEDGNSDIMDNYSKLKFLLNSGIENNDAEDGIKGLYLMPAFFEEKLKAINTGERLEEFEGVTNNERATINKIFEKYIIKEKLLENVV